MGVIDYLNRLVNQVAYAVNLALQIATVLISSGWSVVVYDSSVLVRDVHQLLDDPTCGQEAQCAQLTTIASDLAALSMAIAALGAPQQSGAPVTLPTTPPAGYGTSGLPTVDDIWQFKPVNPGRFPEVQATIAAVSDFINAFKNEYVLGTSQGDHFVTNATFDPTAAYPFSHLPFADVHTILPTDPDLATWLNREEFFYSTWAMDSTTGLAYVADPTGAATYYCTIDKEQFEWYKREVAGKNVTTVSPVWPGLAGVTLGSPHTMVPPGEDLTIDCDGVLVDITGVPSWAGKFEFGTAISWRNVGAVTFTSDNPSQEFAQTFGWVHGLFMPKAMAHAAGYSYRAAIGVSGTLTPFTINS